MELKEFYEKYNLSNDKFAGLAGVGVRSLIKYAKGEKLRESTRARIEKAMRVIEKYNLKRPYWPHTFDVWSGNIHREDQWSYEKRTKELIRKEL